MATITHEKSDASSRVPTPEVVRKRILRQAAQSLDKHSSQLSRMVRCEYKEGALILLGSVPSYYHKQLAHSILKQLQSLEYVQQIKNQIEVTHAE